MKDLALFILSTAGFTWLITRSKLFVFLRVAVSKRYDKNRNNKFFWFLENILNCVGCFGFWSGVANALLVLMVFDITLVCYGCAGIIISLLLINR
jgi:hypothetical protein